MSRAVVLAIVVGSAAAYVGGWWRLARRSGRPLPTPRLVMAMAALAAVATALASPLDGLAHERFSAHMVQHLLLVTVAAPLGLLANPFPVLVWTLPARARGVVGRLFARHGALRGPLRALTAMPAAWTLSAATVWLWHVPALYDRALDGPVVHALEHAALLGAAVVFWWPLLRPAPHVRPAARPAAAIAYVVLAAFQSTALGLGLMLWPTVLYPSYGAGPAALEDQAWGGALMWAVSGVVDMAIVMALVWRFLAAAERRAPMAFLTAPASCAKIDRLHP